MSTKAISTASLILSIIASCAPLGAHELQKDNEMTQAAGMQIYHVSEELPYEMLIKPQVGLCAMLKEIECKVAAANRANVLSSAETNTFNQRAVDISAQLAATRAQSNTTESLDNRRQLHRYATQLAELSQDINDKLQPYVAAALCPGGTCLARTPEALQNQAKELKNRIKDRVAKGTISDDAAREYKSEVERICKTGIASFKEGGNLELSSKTLLKLASRINRHAYTTFNSTKKNAG